ncbi:asparagine synthase-related protein [Halosimplex salinum]|uniref:hypothetical protein n=1 Tax=Halosimplex salinum TaxID=1710538 RepID=UPI000F4A33A0|nr:hypothetical protein [Halosimplex salinum]
MTGLIGTVSGDGRLDEMAAALYREDWYELDRASDGSAAFGVLEHASRDPDANVVWRSEGLIGVVYGVVSNRDRLGLSWGELFRGVVDDGRETLARLDGPFALACVDTRADVVHLATDRAGSRPLYYATGDGIDFASELSPLLSCVDDPALDPRSVADLLSFGGVLGERTLVEGVKSLPPATHLVFDGEARTERYWEPTSEGLAPSGYPDRWLADYRRALVDAATTAADGSLWFPGDGDSRIAAGVLADESVPVETLTCGHRTAGDRESAAQVAAYLDVPNRQVHDDPDRHLVDAVADAVEATDAMVPWTTVDALSYATGRLHDDADTLLYGDPGFGVAPWAGTLQAGDSAAAALYEHERLLPADAVRDLLTVAVDPLDAATETVSACVDGPSERTAVDAARTLRAATDLRGRSVQRSQVGTRSLTAESLLDTTARMPACYRVGTRPLSDPVAGGQPPIRRAVVRRLDPELAQIPTGNGSGGTSRPDVRGGGTTAEAASLATDGDAYLGRYATDDRFRRFVDDLLERVGERDVVDADGVTALHDALAAGELSTFTPVAALTGIELWARTHLDGRGRSVTRRAVEV